MESEKSELITKLQMELSHANDLLTSARHRGALPLTEGEVLSLSPVASSTSSLMESGLTLTQIYSRYVETMSLYRDEKDENTRLTNYLTQIMQELDEKTPALQKLRRDHDTLATKCATLQNKVEEVLEENDTLRLESEESVKVSRSMERENKRLQDLCGDLGKQVRVLLKECEEARGGVVSSTSYDWTKDVSSDSVSSSSQVQ